MWHVRLLPSGQYNLSLAAGAEFEVLAHMIEDGSLLLADAVDVKWNDVFRPEFLEWPAMYSQVP